MASPLDFPLLAAAGLAGSAHCLGMCGPFVLALAAAPATRPWVRTALFHAGRLTTYMTLGAAAGHLGGLLRDSLPLPWAPGALALAAGGLLVIVGLRSLGLLPGRPLGGLSILAEAGNALLSPSLRGATLGGPLFVGVLAGVIPCPLVYALLLQAAGGGSPLHGAMTMAAFGLGTLPALSLLGGAGRWVLPRLPIPAARLSGALVLLLGLVLLWRGLPSPLHP